MDMPKSIIFFDELTKEELEQIEQEEQKEQKEGNVINEARKER